ncbi:hypothetical protein VV208B2_46150 (plasmid) [Vibrio vulnificus]|nr:hypothetical protein VV208B2_46150 [Vibrio vulnificus]
MTKMTAKKAQVNKKIKRKAMTSVLLSTGIGIAITAVVASVVYAQTVERIKTQEDKKQVMPANFDSFPAFIKGMNQDPTRADSDNNGLRDDIQLKIAYQYPFNADKRAALIQYYESLTKLLRLNSEMRELKITYGVVEVRNAFRCLYEQEVPNSVVEEIKSVALDREALRERYDELMEMEPRLNTELLESRFETNCSLLLQSNEQSLQNWVPET